MRCYCRMPWDWCYFQNRCSLLTSYNLHILYKLSLCTKLNQSNSKMWIYKLFYLRMKITRIWLSCFVYLYAFWNSNFLSLQRWWKGGNKDWNQAYVRFMPHEVALQTLDVSLSANGQAAIAHSWQRCFASVLWGGRLQWIWVTFHLSAFW